MLALAVLSLAVVPSLSLALLPRLLCCKLLCFGSYQLLAYLVWLLSVACRSSVPCLLIFPPLPPSFEYV